MQKSADRIYFKEKSDFELVNDFNREIYNHGWIQKKPELLIRLWEEFKAREISLEHIEFIDNGQTCYSLKYPVFLTIRDQGKVLVPIRNDYH